MADFLREAIGARLSAATGREVGDSMLAHLDSMSFLDDNGDIDQAKIQGYAAVMGGTQRERPVIDPVAEALARMSGTSQRSGQGSIADLREQERERMKGGDR